MATKVAYSLTRKKKAGKGIGGLQGLLTDEAVKVGVLKGTGKHPNSDTLTIAQVLAINEFGTEHIPERSVIRHTLRTNRSKYVAMLTRLFRRVLDGKITDRQAIAVFGEKLQLDMQQRMVDLKEPPNAESTIKKKESSNPLIDTGATRQNIRWGLTNAAELRARTPRR